MQRIHFMLLMGLIVLIPLNALATPPLEWSLQNGRDSSYSPNEDINGSISIAPRIDRDYDFATNYNYFFELKQIADFLVVWQEDDPTSPDYGGMIEAEAGELADVIQTDNTLEAIIVWCRYAEVFGDTATFGENIRLAWIYCLRYPPWEEEGDPGEDYYRNHNCAWGSGRLKSTKKHTEIPLSPTTPPRVPTIWWITPCHSQSPDRMPGSTPL